MLIGTNTLDVLFDIYSETDLADRQSLPHGYKVVFKITELRRKQTSGNHQGVVKLQGKVPQLIPAGSTVVVEGVALGRGLQDEKSVIVEYPSSSPLPGGLLLKAGLVDFPQRRPHKLPVVISNESDHDIVIPAKCTIAEVSAYQTILLKEHNKTKQSEPSQRTPETPSSQEPTITFNFGDSPVPLEWKQRITQQLSSMPEVFAQHDLDFGRTDQVRHHIKLSDDTPFKLRARPIHPRDIEAVRKHIQELLDAGVIRESESPFASPIVVVRKKNGQVRLCIDYRRLNLQTIKDAYSLPKLEDTFSALNGSQWFSVLDLKSGYYQIEVEEADKPKTAFVCPLGFWEFNRMPQGVTNAPSTFQRLMERCMGDMHLKDALVFLDDVIVFSRTLEEHEERLMKVLTRLKEFGLKLSPEKCVFFQTSVRYLGHVVSRNGVQTDPEKISALKTWPVPQTLRELKSFLGFAGYYRRFVKGYSSIVKPLHNLTSGYPPSHKKSKTNTRQIAHQYHDPKEPFGGRWTPACQQAFESVIKSLTTAPVLAFADPQKPYILHTDASTTGLGAVLYQEQEGQLRVIGYASRGLSRSENRYPAHKLEFLALKWSVTEKFSDYLYGNHFTVVTDSNPLTYILTSAKLDATSYSVSPDDEREADADCVALVEVLAMSPSAVPDSYGQEEQFGGLPTVPHLTEAELADEQRADQCIKHVISQIEHGDTPPPTVRTQLPELPLLLRELNRLELRNNVLYRRRQEGSQTTYQLVLPAELRNTVLASLHDHMGHMGVDRTLDLARARFYWPRMALDVERKVRTCGRCVRRKARPERAAPLADKSGTKDILVITDHFTKFAVAIPTPNQRARTVARCLWENFMVHYGIPEKLHSDQGPDFESRTIKELCQVAGIHKVRTTPYHPRGNPVERFNRTLLDMLGTLRDQEKSCWRDHVRPLVHAYNCTRNEVTGFTPYELMFGRQPRLPVDLAFNLPVQEEQHSSHSEYVQKLKSRLKESYKLAVDKAAKMAHKNKMRFDRHVTASDLEAGDRVLVRNVRIRGKHKISDKWEHTVHVVVSRAGNLPVYTVKPENKDGPLRTLHRDLLLPCGYLPVEESSEHVQKPVSRRPRTRANPALEEENSSDEDDDLLIPVWFSPPVHTVSERPLNVADVDNPPDFDSQSDFGNMPDMPNSTTANTEYLSTNGVTPTEQVDEPTLIENDSPIDDPDVQEEQLPVEEAGTRGANPEERMEEAVQMDTEETTQTNDSVRRSERNRRPPRRLDYTELGNPLITAAKSFLQGLSSAWGDVISDGEELVPPPSLTPRIII
ncbi:unnamed protein product [Oreochromis niloticus]|nr:unnamed protein product [Mustela putorius furo]